MTQLVGDRLSVLLPCARQGPRRRSRSPTACFSRADRQQFHQEPIANSFVGDRLLPCVNQNHQGQGSLSPTTSAPELIANSFVGAEVVGDTLRLTLTLSLSPTTLLELKLLAISSLPNNFRWKLGPIANSFVGDQDAETVGDQDAKTVGDRLLPCATTQGPGGPARI